MSAGWPVSRVQAEQKTCVVWTNGWSMSEEQPGRTADRMECRLELSTLDVQLVARRPQQRLKGSAHMTFTQEFASHFRAPTVIFQT